MGVIRWEQNVKNKKEVIQWQEFWKWGSMWPHIPAHIFRECPPPGLNIVWILIRLLSTEPAAGWYGVWKKQMNQKVAHFSLSVRPLLCISWEICVRIHLQGYHAQFLEPVDTSVHRCVHRFKELWTHLCIFSASEFSGKKCHFFACLCFSP